MWNLIESANQFSWALTELLRFWNFPSSIYSGTTKMTGFSVFPYKTFQSYLTLREFSNYNVYRTDFAHPYFLLPCAHLEECNYASFNISTEYHGGSFGVWWSHQKYSLWRYFGVQPTIKDDWFLALFDLSNEERYRSFSKDIAQVATDCDAVHRFVQYYLVGYFITYILHFPKQYHSESVFYQTV